MTQTFIGGVVMFGGNFAPRSWAFCDGQLISISQNSALFSLLGTTYGGDGRTTFALPDLRGRVAMHPGRGPGLSSYHLGQKGGIEAVTINVTQIPSHSHTTVLAAGTGKAGGSANGGYIADTNDFDAATGGGNIGGLTVSNTGGNNSHTNMQPFTCVNYIMALEGIYPSRS